MRPRDKVAFTIEDGEVRLTSLSFSVESAFGSVGPPRRPEDFDEAIRLAKDAKVEKTLWT